MIEWKNLNGRTRAATSVSAASPRFVGVGKLHVSVSRYTADSIEGTSVLTCRPLSGPSWNWPDVAGGTPRSEEANRRHPPPQYGRSNQQKYRINNFRIIILKSVPYPNKIRVANTAREVWGHGKGTKYDRKTCNILRELSLRGEKLNAGERSEDLNDDPNGWDTFKSGRIERDIR